MFRLSEFTPKRIKIWMIAGIQLSDDLFFYLLVCESQLSYLRFPVWSWNTWIKQTTETKNSLSFIIDTNDTSGVDTVDMIEVGNCNSAEQDLAIADCRRSPSGQPIA